MTNLARILPLALAMSTLVAVVATAHHPPPPEEPAAPIPMTRVNIVSIETEDEAEQGDYSVEIVTLGLSVDVDDSSALSQDIHLASSEYVLGLCDYRCGPEYAYGDLRNVGNDSQLKAPDEILGQLHLSYSFYRSGILLSGEDYAGWVSTGLSLDQVSYYGESFPLSARDGELTIPLNFTWAHNCEHNEDTCVAGGDNDSSPSQVTEEIWTHDVSLTLMFEIEPGSALDLHASRELDITLDTSGGSFVEIPAFDTPAPVEDAAEATDALTSQDAQTDDPSVDGEGSQEGAADAASSEGAQAVSVDSTQEPVAPIPGPGMPLALVGLGCLAFVRRRA